jgi:hypothetical protein
MTDLIPDEYEAGEWIRATLEAAGVIGSDALATGAFLDVIPGEARLPAVRFGVQARNDVRTNSQHIAVSKWDFLVLGCVEAHNVADSSALAKAIHAALHRANGRTDNLRVVACTRTSTFSFTSKEAGKLFRLGGGVYEIIGQAVAPEPATTIVEFDAGPVALPPALAAAIQQVLTNNAEDEPSIPGLGMGFVFVDTGSGSFQVGWQGAGTGQWDSTPTGVTSGDVTASRATMEAAMLTNAAVPYGAEGMGFLGTITTAYGEWIVYATRPGVAVNNDTYEVDSTTADTGDFPITP